MRKFFIILFSFVFLLNTSAITLDELKENKNITLQKIKDNDFFIQQIKTITPSIQNHEVYPEIQKILEDLEKENKSLKISYGILLDEIELKKMNEYPVAYKIHNFLITEGFTEEIAAGIIGNMMVEAGGRTLAIDPSSYDDSKNYYGICQWSRKYYSTIFDKDLENQLLYLMNTIENEFNTFGNKYKKGFKYKDFLQMEDTKEIALAFAKVYERCAIGGYDGRMACAEEAYSYFY